MGEGREEREAGRTAAHPSIGSVERKSGEELGNAEQGKVASCWGAKRAAPLLDTQDLGMGSPRQAAGPISAEHMPSKDEQPQLWLLLVLASFSCSGFSEPQFTHP